MWKKFASFFQTIQTCAQKKIGSFFLPHGVHADHYNKKHEYDRISRLMTLSDFQGHSLKMRALKCDLLNIWQYSSWHNV